MIYNGVPQFRRSGLLINNGVPNEAIIDDVELLGGVRQLSPNGIEIINGVPQTGAAAASAFPGWTEVDTNGIITVDDASALTANWTINGVFEGANHYAYADAGSAFWTGDFEIQFRMKINVAGTAFLVQFGMGLQVELDSAQNISGNSLNILNGGLFEVGGNNIAGQANEYYSGTQNAASGAGVGTQDGVNIYGKLYRSGSNFGIKWYVNDPTMTDPPDDSASKALAGGVQAYRYLFAFNSYTGSDAVDYEVQILSVTPSPW